MRSGAVRLGIGHAAHLLQANAAAAGSYGDAGPCLRPHCPGARGQCKGFNMHKVAYVDAAKHGTASGSTAVGTPGGEGCGTVATPKSFCSLMKRPRDQPHYSLRGRGAVRPDEIEHCKDFLALPRVAHLLPAPCALSTMMRTAAAHCRGLDASGGHGGLHLGPTAQDEPRGLRRGAGDFRPRDA